MITEHINHLAPIHAIGLGRLQMAGYTFALLAHPEPVEGRLARPFQKPRHYINEKY